MDPTIFPPSHMATPPSSPRPNAAPPQTPTPPTTPLPDPTALTPPSTKAAEPLYTEINIPLPRLPSPKPKRNLPFSPPTSPRPRAHSLASFRPFHRRGSSVESKASDAGLAGVKEEWPRIKKEVKSREVAAAMDWRRRDRRSGTIDALAVVPAVLVLSAELFTPGVEGRGGRKGGWEDGMI